MPGLVVRVGFNNIDAVKARLVKIGDGMIHTQPIMAEVGKELQMYYSGVAFSSQGDVFGAPWAPLSAKYEAYKGSLNHATKTRSVPLIKGQILVWSGKMKDSFGYEATGSGVIVGNTAPYFKYHQSAEPREKIPRRVMLGINDSVRTLVRATVIAGLEKQIKG